MPISWVCFSYIHFVTQRKGQVELETDFRNKLKVNFRDLSAEFYFFVPNSRLQFECMITFQMCNTIAAFKKNLGSRSMLFFNIFKYKPARYLTLQEQTPSHQ